MVIRKMKIEDYDNVYDLWMSCVGMGLNNLDDSKEGVDKFIQRNPDTCLVAEKDSKIIGVIMVGNDGRRGYIYHTAVRPDYRRMGIAGKLVDKAMNELSALGQSSDNFPHVLRSGSKDSLIHPNLSLR